MSGDSRHRAKDDHHIRGASRWLFGVVIAIPLAVYGVKCIFAQSALFFQSRPLQPIQMDGLSAVAVGLIYLCVAGLLHSLFFWGNHPRFQGYGHLAAVGSIAALVASVLFLIYAYIIAT